MFGAGGTGKRVYNMMKSEVDVIGFVDNDCAKWGTLIEYDAIGHSIRDWEQGYWTVWGAGRYGSRCIEQSK